MEYIIKNSNYFKLAKGGIACALKIVSQHVDTHRIFFDIVILANQGFSLLTSTCIVYNKVYIIY